ncbi:hypothetical protein UK23_26420 [Lentzea aerocolonigenes]|uniref:Peptidase inhibitor family I36 protein n=1 Tax=Lentzea aerocolonigenes TaxID=68170 RepID=A0A0F0GRX7_LENAE|nr:peptidase inhibitor family I36 protein [Lentzea aerocolonigenes]KJK45356.1 hypothetical protein UK23_26420 [Lentzea aerocolonigenes]
MKRGSKSVLGMFAVLVVALVPAVVGAGPAAASSGVWTGDSATVAAAEKPPNYNACPLEYFCVYDKYGHMCKWKDNERDWYKACSWAGRNHPKYVYNHGKYYVGVTIYRNVGFRGPVGDCVTWEEQAILAGNYNIGSHAWNC